LRDGDATVVIVTHNINVAARYADTLVLLDRGAVAAAGRHTSYWTARHRSRPSTTGRSPSITTMAHLRSCRSEEADE
jgi:ABC-type glutathione transport system ATPase component